MASSYFTPSTSRAMACDASRPRAHNSSAFTVRFIGSSFSMCRKAYCVCLTKAYIGVYAAAFLAPDDGAHGDRSALEFFVEETRRLPLMHRAGRVQQRQEVVVRGMGQAGQFTQLQKVGQRRQPPLADV